MSQADADRDPLEVLAAEFVQRQRSGQSPSIAEYAEKHPELAAEIQDLFPAIAAIEQLKAHKVETGGARVSLGGPKMERLGDFRILDEIGRGGMGLVYEAFQESLGRHVAVKVLPRQSLLDPKHLQRFQRESQTAARLHHTNIVPVFGVGEQDGFHYIVMQLIRGVGLDAIFAEIQQTDSGSTARTRRIRPTTDAPKIHKRSRALAEILFRGNSVELGRQLYCRPMIRLSGWEYNSRPNAMDFRSSAATKLPSRWIKTRLPLLPGNRPERARLPRISRPLEAPRLVVVRIRQGALPRRRRSGPRRGDSARHIGEALPQSACK